MTATSSTTTFRVLLFLLALVGIAAHTHGSVNTAPKPGWPTKSLAELIALTADAEMAVFDFGKKDKIAFVKDAAWLEEFKNQLAALEGRPDAHCFCIARPIMRLVNGDRELVAIELTHGNKIRFTSKNGSGDYILSSDDHAALVKLMRAALPATVEFPPMPKAGHRPAPNRVELEQ